MHGFLYGFLIFIEIVSALLLIGIILLQKTKDEGLGLAFGAGLGVESVPAFLSHFPPMVGDLFGSAATSGGLVAIALNLILPQEQAATKSLRSQDDRAESV